MKLLVIVSVLLQVGLGAYVSVRLPYANPAGVTYVNGYESATVHHHGLAPALTPVNGHHLQYATHALPYAAAVPAKVETHHVGYAAAHVPAVAAVPYVKHIPTVSHVPVTRIEAQHAVIEKQLDVVRPAVQTRKFEVRRPAIQKQFYDIEERTVVRPAGSALVELQEPTSKVQRGPAVVHEHAAPQYAFAQGIYAGHTGVISHAPVLPHAPSFIHATPSPIFVPSSTPSGLSPGGGIPSGATLEDESVVVDNPDFRSVQENRQQAGLRSSALNQQQQQDSASLLNRQYQEQQQLQNQQQLEGQQLQRTQQLNRQLQEQQQQLQRTSQLQDQQQQQLQNQQQLEGQQQLQRTSLFQNQQQQQSLEGQQLQYQEQQYQGQRERIQGESDSLLRSIERENLRTESLLRNLQGQQQEGQTLNELLLRNAQENVQITPRPNGVAAARVIAQSNGAPTIDRSAPSFLAASQDASPSVVPSVRLSAEENQINQNRLLELLNARGGVTEIGFGREGGASPVGDAGNVQARVLSATPAPDNIEPSGERVSTRRVVVSRPIETLQEFDLVEPATKVERVSVQQPTLIKTARLDHVQVHGSVPVYGKALAPAVAQAAVPVYQKTISPAYHHYYHH